MFLDNNIKRYDVGEHKKSVKENEAKLFGKAPVFTDLFSNSPKRSPRLSPGYEGTENMFYFLNIK